MTMRRSLELARCQANANVTARRWEMGGWENKMEMSGENTIHASLITGVCKLTQDISQQEEREAAVKNSGHFVQLLMSVDL
jgi:hypothetical protein